MMLFMDREDLGVSISLFSPMGRFVWRRLGVRTIETQQLVMFDFGNFGSYKWLFAIVLFYCITNGFRLLIFWLMMFFMARENLGVLVLLFVLIGRFVWRRFGWEQLRVETQQVVVCGFGNLWCLSVDSDSTRWRTRVKVTSFTCKNEGLRKCFKWIEQ